MFWAYLQFPSSNQVETFQKEEKMKVMCSLHWMTWNRISFWKEIKKKEKVMGRYVDGLMDR